MKSISVLIIVLVFNCFIASLSFAFGDIQSSMVKIYTSQNNPSYANPWDTDGPNSISGSGVVISGNRVLTNAHVISNGTFIQVRAHGKATKFKAQVEAVSHDADLALLKVNDLSFFENIDPIELGDVPSPRDPIVVFGFPEGGDTLSMTTGVVSRIEHQVYVHSYLELFAIQVDAAINAGNSGGPAISEDGKIIGVSMQGLHDADNIAYLIPTPVIRHFIEDVKDGKSNGFPTLGIRTQKLENPSLRALYGLDKHVNGILVKYVIPDCSSDGYLKEGDIILKIGEFNLANDKTVEFRLHERTNYPYCIEQKQVGQTVILEILRTGVRHTISIPLITHLGSERLINFEYDRPPTYLIYGGFIFCPLSMNYLTCWGEKWNAESPSELRVYLKKNVKQKDRSQIVVLNKVLPTDSNIGYHDIADEVVKSVDGKTIDNIKDLYTAIYQVDGKRYVELILESKKRIVIDKLKAKEEDQKLMSIYGIDKIMSDDLKEQWIGVK
jgi:S1-C subfamily serine protease